MDAIPLNSIESNPAQSDPAPVVRRGAQSIRGKFGLVVHLAQLPAERGAWACAAARTVGIVYSNLGLEGRGDGGGGWVCFRLLVLHHRVWPECLSKKENENDGC